MCLLSIVKTIESLPVNYTSRPILLKVKLPFENLYNLLRKRRLCILTRKLSSWVKKKKGNFSGIFIPPKTHHVNVGMNSSIHIRPKRLGKKTFILLRPQTRSWRHPPPCWRHSSPPTVHALPHLTVLSLSGCSKMTDDGVELIAENLRKLRSLDLSWCPRITDAALEYIACDLNQLEELTLDRQVLFAGLWSDWSVGWSSIQS